MNKQPDRKQQELREWQGRMNWASEGERNLFLLACTCSVLLPPLGISTLGVEISLMLLFSHLALLLYCATNVQRRFAIATSLIVIISLANFLLAHNSGLKHPELLVYLFSGLGLLSLPFGIRGFLRAQQRARELVSCTAKEDFRWMLTAAPLLTRWRFHDMLREKGITS
ncbi:MAG: hypothetical protein R3F46_10900 [bacterium]